MKGNRFQEILIRLLVFAFWIFAFAVSSVRVAPVFAQDGENTVPVLAVSGVITDEAGKAVGEAWRVRVTNEARKLTVSGTTGASGKYAVAFVGADANGVAAVGETISVSVQDTTGQERGSERHQLTADDIRATSVTIDLRVTPPPPADESTVPALSVSGIITDDAGKAVGEGWRVTVTNEGRQLTLTGTTDATGKYAVAFVDTDGQGVAAVGETIAVTVQDTAGRDRGRERHQLTEADIQATSVTINLQVAPPPSGTPVLTVLGSITDQNGENVGEDWQVQVTNEDRQLTRTATTAPDGKYVVAFVGTAPDKSTVADIGETVSVTVVDTNGQTLGSGRYQLTSDDIRAASVSIDVRVTPPPPGTPVLAVSGVITDHTGKAVAEGWRVQVTNETRRLTVTGTTDAAGRYALAFVGSEPKGVVVAAVGETLGVTVQDTTGKERGSERHQLTLEDIQAASVSIDVNIPPSLLIETIDPNRGPEAGGTSVTITGKNFVVGATVTIGGNPATDVTVVSNTTITAITPAGKAGSTDVVVTNLGGQSGTLPGGFTYNARPIVDAGRDQNANEGQTVNLNATFTDEDGGRHTATIDWGDGTVEPGRVTETAGKGTVTGSHVYADDGSYPVTVTVTDDAGESGTGTLTVTIANAAPVVDPVDDQTANEGNPTVSLSATFTDLGPLDTHTATIDWGDGTRDAIAPATSPVTASHTYAKDDGSYTVSVTVMDDDEGSHTQPFTVRVDNEAPVVDAGADQTVNKGETVTVNATFTDVGMVDVHIATIDWGDGTSDPGRVTETAGKGTVIGSHIYTDAGSYTITIAVTDDDGDRGSDTLDVVVNPVIVVTPSTLGQGAQDVEVTITGAGFQQGTSVSFGDGITQVGDVTVADDTRLKVRLNVALDARIGARPVTITRPDGTSVVKDAAFSVTPKPVISRISPLQGTQGKPLTDVSIIGDHFTFSPTPSISFGEGIDVVVVETVSRTELKVNLTINPIAPIGSREITIINGDFGVGSGVDLFRVEPAPLEVRIRIDPASPTIDEGDTITFIAEFIDPGDNRPHTFKWDFGGGETRWVKRLPAGFISIP